MFTLTLLLLPPVALAEEAGAQESEEAAPLPPTGAVAPEEIAPAKVPPEEIAPAKVAPEEIAPAKVAPEEIAPAKVAPEEIDPAIFDPDDRPAPVPEPAQPEGPSEDPRPLAIREETWQVQHLKRTDLSRPPGEWEPVRWGIRTGAGRYLSTHEFAALTGDAETTVNLRDDLREARRQASFLSSVAAGFGLAALVELAGGGGTIETEDRAWRALFCVGLGGTALLAAPLRVRAVKDHQRHIALHYSAAEAEALVEGYNTGLRARLGLLDPTPAAQVIVPDEPLPAPGEPDAPLDIEPGVAPEAPVVVIPVAP